ALEVIERNASAQAQLIEDLLDISRVVTGRLRLDVRPVVLMPVVEAVLDATRLAAEARQIQLRPVLQPQPCVVAGDPARLQQIIWNLVSNAIKFTPPGGRVEVGLGCHDGHAEISVRDTGAGISPDFLPYVFDRFRQADQTTSRKHGGLGLGLAIVRHLVELHGGTVAAASAGEGQGATFTVRLPLTGLSHPDFGVRTEQQPAPDGAKADNTPSAILRGVRVLVVDDEADAREYIALMLTSYGAETQLAASTAEALVKFKQARPDVLISDIGMPDADGYELIRQVRAYEAGAGRHTPAVAVTAYARPEDRAKASAAGYDEHLAKPVEPADLVARLAALIHLHK
ncbi:MAG TPA: ATP-binding protein, partial [Pyrinomonadaceae bacterium]|nr:ATP-binding protein [Pyrinomonadaceae bacterium]